MTSNKLKKINLVLITLLLTSYINAVNVTPAANSGTGGNTPTNSMAVPANTAPPATSSGRKSNPSAGDSSVGTTPMLSPDKVVLNFENADIQTVIKAISQLSGKNFVIDPRVKGTVNIVSDQPVSKADSYKVLEAALRMQGFASVEADGVIKVLPETDAKTYGMRTETSFDGGKSDKHPLGDQVVTKIFVIQHGSATQLANSLRPLIAPNNSISVYPNSNALIVTDYASNLARIGKVINQLSAVNGNKAAEPVIITLQHAVATDVAQILQSYLNGGGSAPSGGGSGAAGNSDGPATTITVEPTTNSIIIYSPIQDKVNELKALAMKVDTNVGNVHNDLHVVYLKNADANHVADVLRSIVTQQENPDLTASSANAKFLSEPTAVFGSTGGGGSGGSSGGGSGMSSARQSTSSNRGSAAQSANNTNKDAPKVLVQAEPTTNSLIIQAPAPLYKNMRMIIDMLDVRRAQVMIETMIANINATEQGTFGIQWVLGGGNNNLGAVGVANYAGNGNSLSGLATSVIGATSAASGSGTSGTSGINIPNEVYVGLVTGTATVGGTTIPGLSVLADMLTANSLGNVLSRPTLITLDNEEARIMVGSNIGIPNGSFTATSGSPGNLTTTITRQDLGTALQIKPMITQNGAIQLDIFQEDSRLSAEQPINSANGPTYLKQNMRATILVDDGQIIAIGGMTNDQVSIAQNGVPLLSSIPYIGWFFSWQSRTHTKTNVVLFLRPAIIRNADGYKALTNQRYAYIMGEQNQVQAKANWVLPEIKPVNLDNQVPYSVKSAPGNSNPSLNMNQDLPIVDLTNNGANIKNSSPSAVSSTTTMVKPTPPSSLSTAPATGAATSAESAAVTVSPAASATSSTSSQAVSQANGSSGSEVSALSTSSAGGTAVPSNEPVNLANVSK